MAAPSPYHTFENEPPLPAGDYWMGKQEYGAGSSLLIPPVDMASRSGPRSDCSSPPPTLKSDRDVPAISRAREHVVELVNAPVATNLNRITPALMDRSSPQAPTQEHGYSYHRPPHYQSLSTSSIRPHDHTTLAASAAYGYHYQDMGRCIDIGTGGDSKQRKRRGNLPKETTDKLRAWFVAHLQHPYPTEDEKQELMRQTGLQM
ncbi:hypothetical protein E4U53_003966, partial [Claviceps sorghi]